MVQNKESFFKIFIWLNEILVSRKWRYLKSAHFEIAQAHMLFSWLLFPIYFQKKLYQNANIVIIAIFLHYWKNRINRWKKQKNPSWVQDIL